MPETKLYHLSPTPLIPNSPYPIIHYPGLLLPTLQSNSSPLATIHDLFHSNGWQTQWVFSYASTQGSHYHSTSHECMAVVSGRSATIRFGAADLSSDMESNTHGSAFEKDGAVYVTANLGDVFIIPAGVAHKTFDVEPCVSEIVDVLGAGGRLKEDAGEARKRLEKVELGDRFMMMGAYPFGCEWDWKEGGDHEGRFEEVWRVRRPERDPVLGRGVEGLVGLWGEREGERGEGKSRM